MTTEVKERVVTEFEISDRATAHLGTMQTSMQGMGSMIESTKAHFFSLKNVIIGALAGVGIGLSVHKITELGSAFENTRNQMAGFFQVQKQAPDFPASLGLAEKTMAGINREAAKLPGMTEEYYEVFLGAFANVRQATKGSMEDIYHFTNKMTALGKSFGLDSGTISRNVMELLAPGHGRAMMRDPMWIRLLSSIHQLKGYSDLTAESFNKMTATERFKILTNTIGQFKDSLAATATTWGALLGTFRSDINRLLRLSTQPIFDAMKLGVSNLNDILVDANGNLTDFGKHIVSVGQTLSTTLVNGVTRVIDALTELQAHWDAISEHPAMQASMRALSNVTNLPARALSMAEDKFIRPRHPENFAGGLPQVYANGPQAAGQTSFANANERIAISLSNMLERFTTALVPVISTVLSFGSVVERIYSNVMPGLISAVDSVAGPIVEFGSNIINRLGRAFDYLRPYVSQAAAAVGYMAEKLGSVLGPALTLLGEACGWLFDKFASLVEYIDGTILSCLARLASAIGWVLDQIGWAMGQLVPKITKVNDAEEAAKINADWTPLRDMALTGALLKEVKHLANTAAKPPPGRGGGGRAVQDFRYSRFEIQQKFAEGYDPDRIAVAFAKDVGRIGEMRLQSAHEPLYSTH